MGDTKLLACAKRWSGGVEWSGVLQTPNWSGVLIRVYFNLQWVPLCPAVPEVDQSHVVTYGKIWNPFEVRKLYPFI